MPRTTKIRNLKDNQQFRIGEHGKVFYTLQKLDKKRKTAIYSSNNSGRTSERNWNMLVVFPVNIGDIEQ